MSRWRNRKKQHHAFTWWHSSDVLGFGKRIQDVDLMKLLALYDQLIEVDVKPNVKNEWLMGIAPISERTYVPVLYYLPMRYVYFSDSILIWVPYHPNFVTPFLHRCSNVFCQALKSGLPLRGAISVGEMILHQKTNTFLGKGLVEADRLEHAQEWLGIAAGISVRSETLRIPFSPECVMVFDAPVKTNEGKPDLRSGLVLDWPRVWRESYGESAAKAVEGLRAAGFEKYYDNALSFVKHSDNNHDWFLKGPISEPETGDAEPLVRIQL
jgi:hypothetical protein